MWSWFKSGRCSCLIDCLEFMTSKAEKEGTKWEQMIDADGDYDMKSLLI